MAHLVLALLLCGAGGSPAWGGPFFPKSAFSKQAAGTTGEAFLELAADARSASLGATASAGAAGSDALLSNPAGLASLGSGSASDLSLSFNSLLDTSYLGYVAFAQALRGAGVLGADVVYFSQQAMTAYSGLGQPQGSFQPADWSAAIAYARQFDGFSVGADAKFIRSALADVSGLSAAVDLGVQAKSVFLLSGGPVDWGAYFSNLGPPIKLGGVSSPLPFAAVAGLLWHGAPAFTAPSAASLPWDLDAGFDLHCPVDQAPYAALGLEAGFRFDGQRRKAAVRVGYNQSSAGVSGGSSGLTAGAGLDLQSFRLDYAWAPFGELGMQNRVTLALRF